MHLESLFKLQKINIDDIFMEKSNILAFIIFFLIVGSFQMAFNKFYPKLFVILIISCILLTNNYNKETVRNNK